MFEKFRKAVFKDDSERIINIPIDEIAPSPVQVRQYYDNLSLAELAKSIEEYGVIQPITVRLSDDEGYELVSGERRLRASIMAGLETIPCIVIDADIKKSAVFSLLENLQREELSFFEVAQSYKSLIREQGLTQEELAKKIGKSQSTISNKLRLLKLSPKVRRRIKEYAISERHARCVLAVPDEALQLEIIGQIYREKLNLKQTEHLIEEYLSNNKKPLAEIKLKKDSLAFLGTVRRAVETMRKNGVDASIQKVDRDWGTEYVIEIKQPHNNGTV